jgi:Dermonecrotoxin of the Papain-like fold
MQRAYGNRAVQHLLASPSGQLQRTQGAFIQRSYKDNPAQFIEWITARDEYKNQISNAEGACATAAKALGPFLAGEDFAPIYRGILLFPRKCDKSELNRNHFVIVVNVAGTNIVIDPTQAQFENGSAQVAVEHDWQATFQGVKVVVATAGTSKTYGAKFKDFADFDGANGFAKERLKAHDAVDGTVLIAQPPEHAPGAGGRTCVIV